MKQILRQTFELFRQNPILWVPYIVAQLLAGCVWRMRTSVAQHLLLAAEHIFDWMFGRRSAFGFFVETPRSDVESLRRFAVAYAPVGFISQFLYVGVFVIALVVTAEMVELIVSGKEPQLMTAVESARRRWRPILRFSLKSYVICFVFFGLAMLSIWFVPGYNFDWQSNGSLVLFSAVVLPFVAIASWLLIPGTLRLLQPSEQCLIHTDTRRQAVVFTVLAIASTFAVEVILFRIVDPALFETQRELSVVVAAGELLTNSAIAPLFIALSHLALRTPDTPQSEDELPL